jgi:hypothetical protein
VHEFWSWWAVNRDGVIAAAKTGNQDQIAHLLGPAVDRLHPEVAWEFGPGSEKRAWELVVSPGGVRALLPFTIEWAEAAPPDDFVEFLPVRARLAGGIEGAVLEVDGSNLALDETLVRIAEMEPGVSIDVEVHHPAFPRLSEADQFGVAFHALDLALGEFVVMTCLQRVVPVNVRLPDMRPLTALPAVIREALPNGPHRR